MFGGGLEGPGLLIILAIVLILFGGKKLPGLAKGFGQAKREFEDATASQDESVCDQPAVAKPEMVTMSKADLENLLATRDAQSRTLS